MKWRSDRMLDFLGSKRGLGLASWIQTAFIAVTLVYGVRQLGQLVEQNEIPKRAEFNRRYEEWLDKYQLPLDNVILWSYRARMKGFSSDELSAAVKEHDPKQLLDDYVRFAHKFWECAEQGLCVEASSAALLCGDSTRLYQAINARGETPLKSPWSARQLWYFNPSLESLISATCGRARRFAFWSRMALEDLLAKDPPKTSDEGPTTRHSQDGSLTATVATPQPEPSVRPLEIFFFKGSAKSPRTRLQLSHRRRRL